MKKIKSTAAQIAQAVNLTSTKIKSFMTAALIACAATLGTAVVAEAQSIPIGLGIDLGQGLLAQPIAIVTPTLIRTPVMAIRVTVTQDLANREMLPSPFTTKASSISIPNSTKKQCPC